MKLLISLLTLISVNALAANKIAEKVRVLEEKLVSAESCSVKGEYTNNLYGDSYVYTVTMNVTMSQKIETYSVEMKKSLTGKITEVEIPNSKKTPDERKAPSTQSIQYSVRYPGEQHRIALLKICDDERTFINTGAYPPPPPPPPRNPVIVIPEPQKPATTDPLLIPTLPGIPTVPSTPTTPSQDDGSDMPVPELFPIVPDIP